MPLTDCNDEAGGILENSFPAVSYRQRMTPRVSLGRLDEVRAMTHPLTFCEGEKSIFSEGDFELSRSIRTGEGD